MSYGRSARIASIAGLLDYRLTQTLATAADGEIDALDRVVVRQKRRRMRLLHPVGHDYFELLRAKLRWGVNPEGATSNR